MSAGQRINEAVHRSEQTPRNDSYGTPRPPVRSQQSVSCINTSGYTLQKGYLVETSAVDSDTGRVNVIRPTDDSRPNTLIVLGDNIGNGEYFEATRGFDTPTYIQYTGTAPVAGEALGSTADSFLATVDNEGYVCHTAEIDTTLPGNGVRGGFFRVKGCRCGSLPANRAYIYVGAPLPSPIPIGETHVSLDINSVQSWLESNSGFDGYQIKIMGDHTLEDGLGLTLIAGKQFNIIGKNDQYGVKPEIIYNEGYGIFVDFFSLQDFACVYNIKFNINVLGVNSLTCSFGSFQLVNNYIVYMCSCDILLSNNDVSGYMVSNVNLYADFEKCTIDHNNITISDGRAIQIYYVFGSSINSDITILTNTNAGSGRIDLNVLFLREAYKTNISIDVDFTADAGSVNSSVTSIVFNDLINSNIETNIVSVVGDGYTSEFGGGVSSSSEHIFSVKNNKKSKITYNLQSDTGNGGDGDELNPESSGGDSINNAFFGVGTFSVNGITSDSEITKNITLNVGNGGNAGGYGGSSICRITTELYQYLLYGTILNSETYVGSGSAGSGGSSSGVSISEELFNPSSIPSYKIKNVTNNNFIPYAITEIGEYVYIDTVNGDDDNNGDSWINAIKISNPWFGYIMTNINIKSSGASISMPNRFNSDLYDGGGVLKVYAIKGFDGAIAYFNSSDDYKQYTAIDTIYTDSVLIGFNGISSISGLPIVYNSKAILNSDVNSIDGSNDISYTNVKNRISNSSIIDNVTFNVSTDLSMVNCSTIRNCDIKRAIYSSTNILDCRVSDYASGYGFISCNSLFGCVSDSNYGGFNQCYNIEESSATNNTACGFLNCTSIDWDTCTESGNGGTGCDLPPEE